MEAEPSPQPLMTLSQGSLALLTECPRKFQYEVLEQLAAPRLPDDQERMQQGAQFHALVQQWQLGLPVESLAHASPHLERWFAAFRAAAPEMLTIAPNPPDSESSDPERYVECDRTLFLAGYLLTVRYDVLLRTAEQAQILDWKTYPRPAAAEKLCHTWQTRLYLFVLAETSPYQPEQLYMLYWFFQDAAASGSQAASGAVQQLRCGYSRRQQDQTRQALTGLLTQLTDWRSHYAQGQPFPQLGIAKQHCETCPFSLRCFGGGVAPANAASQWSEGKAWEPLPMDSEVAIALPNLADIPELPL
jgi:hypothetical protein